MAGGEAMIERCLPRYYEERKRKLNNVLTIRAMTKFTPNKRSAKKILFKKNIVLMDTSTTSCPVKRNLCYLFLLRPNAKFLTPRNCIPINKL